jgi:hypothetical protein
MAAKKQWLLRVPEIRQDVAALEVPVLDRILFERLFHVGWRRAIDLMHAFGAYQTGQALLIDRTVLLQQLEALEAGMWETTLTRSRRSSNGRHNQRTSWMQFSQPAFPNKNQIQ